MQSADSHVTADHIPHVCRITENLLYYCQYFQTNVEVTPVHW